MVRKVKAVGLAGAAVLLAALLAPIQGAYAADGCGDGWFKQSDGYLTKSVLWQGAGAHNAWMYHSGRVRFCTEDDTFNNDENRRALIGYPDDSYPFQSEIDKNGTYTKFCVRQTIKAHMTGISSSSSFTVGGSVTGPEVSTTYSSETKTATVTIARNAVCGATDPRLFARTGGVVVTAENETGKVDWVHLDTTITAQYTYKGAKYSDSYTLPESDNS